MKVFLKIVVTFFFCIFWGSLARGCQSATTGPVKGLVSIFSLILLAGGIYGIWKYNSNSSKKDDDHKLDKE